MKNSTKTQKILRINTENTPKQNQKIDGVLRMPAGCLGHCEVLAKLSTREFLSDTPLGISNINITRLVLLHSKEYTLPATFLDGERCRSKISDLPVEPEEPWLLRLLLSFNHNI